MFITKYFLVTQVYLSLVGICVMRIIWSTTMVKESIFARLMRQFCPFGVGEELGK